MMPVFFGLLGDAVPTALLFAVVLHDITIVLLVYLGKSMPTTTQRDP